MLDVVFCGASLRVRIAAVALALACAYAAPAAAALAAGPPGDTVTAALASADIKFRAAASVSGTLKDPSGAPLAGRVVLLQASPWPYRGWRVVSHATSAPDGTFAFTKLIPDRNTRYRAVEYGMPTVVSAPLSLTVEVPGVLHLHRLPYGLLTATVLSFHSKALNWNHVPAYWFVAAHHTRTFHLVAVTLTRELRPGVTYATATFLPPMGRFSYRVCFNGRDSAGIGQPGSNGRCPHHDFRVPHAV